MRFLSERTGVWLRLMVLPAVALGQTGCNYLLFMGLLLGGPPSIEPDFEVLTKKSMTAKNVTVAVVCYAPTEVKWDFEDIDSEIAKYVTLRLHQHKIKVIDPDHVRAWLDRNPEWDKPEEVGEAFDASYVIYIDMHKFSLWEAHSTTLYRGRSEAMVSVIEMDAKGRGDKVYTKEVVSQFPLSAPREASNTTSTHFKREYLSRLSQEIGRLFYEHHNGDDFVDAS